MGKAKVSAICIGSLILVSVCVGRGEGRGARCRWAAGAGFTSHLNCIMQGCRLVNMLSEVQARLLQ